MYRKRFYLTIPSVITLAFAGVAKLTGLFIGLTEPIFGVEADFLVAVLAGLELVLSGWIFSGIKFEFVKKTCFFVFAIFLFVGLLKILRNESNCGCFGLYDVSPFWSFLVAVVCLISLSLSGEPHRNNLPHQFGRIFCFSVVLLTFGGYAVSINRVIGVDEIQLNNGNRVVRVDPDGWVGKKFPLMQLDQLNPDGRDISHGNWEVILVKHDCKNCMKFLKSFFSRIRQPDVQIAVIELPPNGPSNFIYPGWCRRFTIDDNRRWYTPLPVRILIDEGIVTSVDQ